MISLLFELGWFALELLGEVCLGSESSLVEEFMKWERPLV